MNITPDQAQEWLDNADLGSLEPVPEDPDYTDHDDEWELHEVGEPAFVTLPVPNAYQVVALLAAAPDLAQTIAGMEWEYGLRQPRPEPHAEGELYTSWGYRLFAAKAAFAGLTDRGVECYIVRRLVGPVEVIDGE